MKIKADSPEDYINALPEERKIALSKMREVIRENLPEGFKEEINYGMIGYVVPHNIYPAGYHCDPKLPLPFINIASQKNFVALYHMGIYVNEDLLNWFTEEYSKFSNTKLDMGKSCIRFKKMDSIPYELIGNLASRISPQQWVEVYEKMLKKK